MLVTQADSQNAPTSRMTAHTSEELERYKEILEATGDYRVLRRSGAVREFGKADSTAGPLLRGVYLDVETTGLERSDVIIELGLVAFEYDRSGRVYRVVDELDEFEDPNKPLSDEIVQPPAENVTECGQVDSARCIAHSHDVGR